MKDIESVLEERGETHGDWHGTADTHSKLMAVIEQAHADHNMCGGFSTTQRAALMHITGKLARVACGDSFEPDHWQDIGGYGTLQAKLEEKDALARAEDESPCVEPRLTKPFEGAPCG